MSYLGNTYELTDVTAYDIEGREIKINGRYEVVEWQGYEPAAGILSSYWTLFPEGEDDDIHSVTVDPYDLEFAIEPEEAQKRADQEAEWEREMELDELREAELEAEMWHQRFLGGEAV